MSKTKMRLPIQFFAGEGAASGGGEGAAAGSEGGNTAKEENPSASQSSAPPLAGEAGAEGARQDGRSLESLGVPRDKAEKYRQRMEKRGKNPSASQGSAPPRAGEASGETGKADATAQEGKGGQQPKLRDLLAQNPEYNREMQEIVKGRLTEQENSVATLSGIRNYGVQAKADGSLDYEALGKAIREDDALYEKRADELGTDVATARRMDELERFQAETRRREQQDLQEKQTRAHIQKLVQQGAELQKIFPNFDLRRELQNETFRRWTSPQIGMSVKDAYYALHREEIRRAENEAMARAIQERVAASVAAGQARPNETGRAQGGSVTPIQSPQRTRKEHQELKKRIQQAAARGEKIYPR